MEAYEPLCDLEEPLLFQAFLTRAARGEIPGINWPELMEKMSAISPRAFLVALAAQQSYAMPRNFTSKDCPKSSSRFIRILDYGCKHIIARRPDLMNQIRRLELCGAAPTEQWIFYFTGLEYLHWHSMFETRSAYHIRTRMPNLRHLDVEFMSLSSFECHEVLDELAQVSSLEYFNLEFDISAGDTSSGSKAMRKYQAVRLGALTRLQEFKYKAQSPDFEMPKDMFLNEASFRGLSSLTSLTLQAPMSDATIRSLPESLPTLRKLTVTTDSVSRNGAQFLLQTYLRGPVDFKLQKVQQYEDEMM